MAKKLSAFSQFDDPTIATMPVVRKSKHIAEQLDLLTLPANEIQTPLPQGPKVPNQFPKFSAAYKIAIIGEAPGEEEEQRGEPFVGQSGRYLDQVLSKTGIARGACFVGNVCQYRPPNNDIKLFNNNDSKIQDGLKQLRLDLKQFDPNIVILLGKTALWAAHGSTKIFDWRGSLFLSDRLIDPGIDFIPPVVKCIATLHPAYCLRMYDATPLVMLDFRKALVEATTKDLTLPIRELKTTLSFPELCHELDQIITLKPTISPDIEGGVDSMSCVSLATSPDHSFLVPFTSIDGSTFWPELEQEMEIWKKFAQIMADPQIPKVFQNGLYDRFVLQHSYNILVRNSLDDTMLKFWESYCELEKNLGFQCSILTKEPYYKFERKTDDEQTHFRYCCKDSCVTFEINSKLSKLLDASGNQHYSLNSKLLYPLLYMELRGIRYNENEARTRYKAMQGHVFHFQFQLDQLAKANGAINGIDFDKTNLEVLSQVQSICCYVRDRTQPKADALKRGYTAVAKRLSNPSPLSDEERAQVSILCKATMNTKSKVFKDFLYRTCNLPIQYKKDLKTKELKETTDYLALLKLSKNSDHPALNIALELSRLRTRAQMLAIQPFQGRMHCSYNLVGSETGRISSSKAILFEMGKKVGANMQTIPDDWDMADEEHPLTQGMRDLMLADEGCYIGKCDLKGADGWTVGSYMAWLGDPTMLDDLKCGLKPAQVVAYILKHGAGPTIGKDRNELKEMCKEIKKDDWEYFVSKQGIWGTCYTMGPRKLAEVVFIQSEGKVNLSEKDAREFQACIQVRYRVILWHKWMSRFLESQNYPAKLTASNGFTRKFFGRNGKNGQRMEILGEALAHLPQVYTTYATKLAAYKLWTDPENRIQTSSTACRLRVEPMHQVHDELVVQFKIEDTFWAITKIKSWFNNSIQIANQNLVIPFDGAYGTNWGMGEDAKVGEIK